MGRGRGAAIARSIGKTKKVNRMPTTKQILEMLICHETGESEPRKAMAIFKAQCLAAAEQRKREREQNRKRAKKKPTDEVMSLFV